MNKEMTAGKPGKMILNFTIPIFIGNIFQQLYSMADTVIVGKFVGNEALAAVGACGTLMFLIIGFLLGLTAGFTVITAQHYGAGNLQAMRQSVASGAILSAAVSLILTILSMAMMKDILRWMHTPADMYDQAYGYIMVICGGIAAQTLYNLLASILRALGDSRRPLYFLILAAFLNIVLDLLFIIKFGMGAAGAAYATVISQGVSGLLCLFYIMRKIPELHLGKEDWKMNWDLAKWQMKIGFPMAFQFSITAIGTIVVQSALNMLGSVACCRILGCQQDRAGGYPGLCGPWNRHGDLLCPERRGRPDRPDTQGISKRCLDGRRLCRGHGYLNLLLWEIYDGAVCIP